MKFLKNLKNIKALLVDVDGILTDGNLWMDSAGQWRRNFNIYDGFGLRLLKKEGFIVGIITGSDSEDIRQRRERLGIEHLYEGSEEKMPSFKDFLAKTNLSPSEVAYIGDDLPDVPVLEMVGFSATVPGAMPEAKKVAQYITRKEGGKGAVRELCDLLLAARSPGVKTTAGLHLKKGKRTPKRKGRK